MPANQTLAVQLFERATARGSWRAPYQLMKVFEIGWGEVAANLTRAVEAYREYVAHLPHWGDTLQEASEEMENGGCWQQLWAHGGRRRAAAGAGWMDGAAAGRCCNMDLSQLFEEGHTQALVSVGCVVGGAAAAVG